MLARTTFGDFLRPAFQIFFLALMLASSGFAQTPLRGSVAQPPAPFRGSSWLGAPAWLQFSVEHRARFEHLANDFRVTARGNSTALVLRTTARVEFDYAPVFVALEVLDARAYATSATPLNAGIVNPFDLLQAHLGVRRAGLVLDNDQFSLKLGRLTIDLGSRRLLARNAFRNTINTFTGIDVQYVSQAQHLFRVFSVLPVQRAPSEAAALATNQFQLDQDNTDQLLSGLFVASKPFLEQLRVEAYLLTLFERDAPNAASSNRRLFTPGFRVMRAPVVGAFDFQFEAMLQLGVSRATAQATDTRDLAHRAYSIHATVGFKPDTVFSLRVALQYDFASGDSDSQDQVNGRFDSLFGARRFEFGPTGLYGALARTNLSSPGLRVEVAPLKQLDALVAYRPAWLASASDAWAPSGLVDKTGASGAFIGHQIEGQARFNVLPGNVSLEVGAAWLIRGQFAREAPGAKASDSVYVYTQLTGTL